VYLEELFSRKENISAYYSLAVCMTTGRNWMRLADASEGGGAETS
jgi:hypothetical protein